MISIALTKGRIEKELVKVLEKSNFSVDELKDKGRKLVFNDNLNDIRYFLQLFAICITAVYIRHSSLYPTLFIFIASFMEIISFIS